MEASELKRIKELEQENSRLKRMYANLAMELDTAKYIIEKSFKALREAKDHRRASHRSTQRHQQGVSYFTGEQKQFVLSICKG